MHYKKVLLARRIVFCLGDGLPSTNFGPTPLSLLLTSITLGAYQRSFFLYLPFVSFLVSSLFVSPSFDHSPRAAIIMNFQKKARFGKPSFVFAEVKTPRGFCTCARVLLLRWS